MNLFNSCIDSFFAGMTLALHKSQRQVAKLATDCSIVGLYYVTITWQQIFKDSIKVIGLAACDCWMQTSVAGNTARQWPL